MKKLYIVTSFLLVSALTFSQFSENLIPEPTDVSKRTLKSHLNLDPNGTKATPFWSEDFSGGIPATWTNGSTPTPPVISAPWVYRGPSTTPIFLLVLKERMLVQMDLSSLRLLVTVLLF